ncbi:MAG: extracellular solute-binding protein [Chloroflexi bacterium]|nr:extracellular solute-binding protein [Chloroflexota bacterium]
MTHKVVSRRDLLKATALGGGAIVLAACAAPAAPEAAAATAVPAAAAATAVPVAAAPPAKVDITLDAVTDLTGNPEMWDEFFAELKEKTGVTINVNKIPFSEVEPKMLTSVAGGIQPDLTMGHPMLNSTFGFKGLLVDMNPYIEKEKYDTSGLFPGAFSSLSYGGKTYGLPYSFNALLYYYNKKTIVAAGMEDPYEVFKAGKWNFETFVKYGDDISRGEGTDQIFSITEPPKTSRVQLSMLRGYGGEIWTEDLKTVVIDSKESLLGWEFIADHVRKGWSPAAAGRDQQYQPTMTPLFNNNQLAIYLNIRSFTSAFDLNLLDPGMVPYPTWPNGKDITRCVGEGLTALVGTEYADAIWECNKWWSTRGHEILLAGGGSVPNGPGPLASDNWKKALAPWEKNDVYEAAFASGIPDNLPPAFGEQDKICQSFYDEVALGRRSAKEAMGDARVKMQEVLNEYL